MSKKPIQKCKFEKPQNEKCEEKIKMVPRKSVMQSSYINFFIELGQLQRPPGEQW